MGPYCRTRSNRLRRLRHWTRRSIPLARRENDPVKWWFVPGGTVLNNETRREVVHRVANEELGNAVVIDEAG